MIYNKNAERIVSFIRNVFRERERERERDITSETIRIRYY